MWGRTLRLCRGGLALNFDKNSTDLFCFIFQFGGLELCLWGLRPPKPPCVKVKLLEFKSLQVKLLQYLMKIATYSKQDMNHIFLVRLAVLKRPGFQSRKYVMPA